MSAYGPITRKTAVWRFVMGVLHVFYTCVWPTRVVGRDLVPRRGRVMIIANHQSFLDIPLLARGVLHRHVAFVARQTLARSAFLGWVMRNTGTILIDRDKGDRAALRKMVAHLEAEDAVAVFPEGTRCTDGRLGAPKKGALLAARMAGAPIVPCAISGSWKAWPRSSRFPRPGRLVIRFAAPLDPGPPDALERTWSTIAEMLDQGSPRSRPHDAAPEGGETRLDTHSENP